MSGPDWKELEQVWQDSPAMAPMLEIIARQRRNLLLSRVGTGLDFISTLLGVGISIWAIGASKAFLIPLAGSMLLFSVIAGAASLWARLPRRVTSKDSVSAALDAAIQRARGAVRLALASLWLTVVFMLSMSAVAFLWMIPAYTPPNVLGILIGFGTWAACIGVGLTFSLIYYLRRSRELIRLEEIKLSLRD